MLQYNTNVELTQCWQFCFSPIQKNFKQDENDKIENSRTSNQLAPGKQRMWLKELHLLMK